MLVKLIRFFRGYVIFSASGSFPERLINLLNRYGINYWDLFPNGKSYTGKMLLSDYKGIRSIAKKSEVRLKCKKRVGFPFLVKKYKRRKGIAAGVVLALILMVFLSQFVWDVKINGSERLSGAEINSVLADYGLKAGALKSSLDFEAIERKLVLKMPEIRWVSINALNSIAEVEIKEKLVKPKLKKGKYPCNLVASEDGVITDIMVVQGTCKVKRKSAVSAGQILVSTVVEGTNEMQNKLSYVHAGGKIFADVTAEKSFSLNKKKKFIVPEKNYIQKSDFNILWFNFPFKLNSSSSEIKSEIFKFNRLYVNDVTLPIGMNYANVYSFTENQTEMNKKDAKILLKKKVYLSEAFNLGKYKIKESKYSYKEIKNKLVLNAKYIVNKNIAIKRRVNIE